MGRNEPALFWENPSIKGYNEYNSNINKEKEVNEADLEAAENDNWFTENLINMATSDDHTQGTHY